MSSISRIASPTSYESPSSVEEALDLARFAPGECDFIAGGTDSELQRRSGLRGKPHVVDLSGIRGLRAIRIIGQTLEVGALCTLYELAASLDVLQHSPLLCEAAESIATPVIRKTATVGGNVLVSNRCTYYNQSRFWRQSIGSCLRDVGDTCLVTGVHGGKCFARNVSDLAPALIVLNAVGEIQSDEGVSTVALSDFYVQDGLRPLAAMRADCILTRIRVPQPARRWGFHKLRLRKSLDFTSLTAAASLDSAGILRMSLNGVAMAPIVISGKLSDLSLRDLQHEFRLKAKVVDNDLLPLHYRKRMMDIYVEELWNELTSSENPG